MKKRLAGLRAKRNGQIAEHVLEKTASCFGALIYKRYEPYKRVSKGGGKSFRAIYTEKSGCDYSFFLPDGKAGMIEVKSRQSRINKSAIDEVQHTQLLDLLSLGHLAFVLIYISGEWVLVDYYKFISTEQKSYTLEQLLTIGVHLEVEDGILVNLLENLK